MRRTCRLGREVLDLAALAVRPGVRCSEIDTIVHEACMQRGCYPSPLNYRNFPKSVCTSVNEVICHGVPDAYELKEGDIWYVRIRYPIYSRYLARCPRVRFPQGGPKCLPAAASVLLNATGWCSNLDVTVYKEGFHGDLNETYFVGTPSDEVRHLVQVPTTPRRCASVIL